MKKLLWFLSSLLLLISLAAPSFAQEMPKKDAAKEKKAASERTNFGGEVTAVNSGSITVKTDKGDKTAAITAATKYTSAKKGQTATAADIKAGSKVRVWASKDAAGNWQATTIRLMS